MWGNSSRISPLVAACAEDSPEAFRILFDETSCHFAETDYQEGIRNSQAPAWVKEALLAGGFTTLPESIQFSERDARLVELLKEDESDARRKPEMFHDVFLSNIASSQPAIAFAAERRRLQLYPSAGSEVPAPHSLIIREVGRVPAMPMGNP